MADPERARARAAAAARDRGGQRVEIPGDGVVLSGRLFAPSVDDRVERRPAIVLLHGCGGMANDRGVLAPRHREWAERFAGWGYVALLVDSFRPRRAASVCTQTTRERTIEPWRERTQDALASLAWLAARDDVDPRRVFVLGWSHGGSTVLGVVRDDLSRGTQPRFAAAVAYYPGCARALSDRRYRTSTPLLILIGEADDWTAAGPCVSLQRRLADSSPPVRIVTYPDAHHGFDGPGTRIAWLPDVFNPGAPGGRGAHVGPNPAAREQAIVQTRAFLAEFGGL